MRKVIGVDLGGTNIRTGLVEGDKIIKITTHLVPKANDADIVNEALIAAIKNVFSDGVESIGIGIPGLVKSKEGIVFDIVNIPSWKNIHLRDILQKEFDVPVYINNDANCFAIGERIFGAGKEFSDFVGLITGTGMGAGIVKAGRLIPDQNCGAGEFGMIPYLDGVYENYCSGQFFKGKYNTEGSKLAVNALAGEKNAIGAFNEYGRHLGTTIKTILFAVDPKAVIIGGSVSKSFSLYKKAMWDEISTFPYRYVVDNLKIKVSEMKESAILGAAALCGNLINNKI